MSNRLLFMALFFSIVSLSGCVTNGMGGKRGGESLAQQVSRHDQQIQSILSQVGQVEQVLPGQAEMWSQMQSMRQELNSLHGQLDVSSSNGESGSLQARVDRLESALRQVASQMGITVSELDAPLSSSPLPQAMPVPTGGTSTYTPPSSNKSTPSLPVPPAAKSSNTAQVVYDSGIKAFDKRDYKEAISIFRDFTASYPSHSLSSNALFWEGECYYQLKDYAHATLAYQDVIDKFPASNKIQSSMLKQGMSLYSMNKKEAGKERLEGLIKRYPNSMEATRAKKFMESNK